MSTINQNLLDRLVSKLDVSKQRVYQLIQEISHRNHVRRHIGALLLAGDHGISVQKYARAEDLNELRGIPNHVQVHVPSEAASPASSRKKKSQSIPKTKENTVFVVHGRDTALRNAMYEFLGALGLRVQEWGHAIRAARGHGGNPYVGDAVFKIMESAQAIVVMLSPDDEAKLKDQFVRAHERSSEGKLRGQARPNVIFETGIAVGTHHKKTVMVQVGRVKPFSDIGGKHIPHLSNDQQSRNEFANRLEDLRCKIDRAGDHWLKAGDFTPTGLKIKRTKRTTRLSRKSPRRRS